MKKLFLFILLAVVIFSADAQDSGVKFKVVAFFTAKNDIAHITFVHEANKWFAKMAPVYHFSYDSTNDWNNMNSDFLSNYDVVLFLDTRPDSADQRRAFQEYIEKGGGWIGFHFAGFALTPSDYPQNWDWYHNQFIGAGQYKSNTWRPTSAILKVEDRKHPVTRGLPKTFKASPNEWYRWENDLTKNPDIDILMSIDPKSFPLGTGPKQNEIWHSGYYPVVWTNKKYRMLYVNMGHNDIDYEHGTNEQLSSTFGNPVQDKMIVNALLWLGRGRRQ